MSIKIYCSTYLFDRFELAQKQPHRLRDAAYPDRALTVREFALITGWRDNHVVLAAFDDVNEIAVEAVKSTRDPNAARNVCTRSLRADFRILRRTPSVDLQLVQLPPLPFEPAVVAFHRVVASLPVAQSNEIRLNESVRRGS
jgi:hypothetical protein